MDQGVVPRPGVLNSPAHMSRAIYEKRLVSCVRGAWTTPLARVQALTNYKGLELSASAPSHGRQGGRPGPAHQAIERDPRWPAPCHDLHRPPPPGMPHLSASDAYRACQAVSAGAWATRGERGESGENPARTNKTETRWLNGSLPLAQKRPDSSKQEPGLFQHADQDAGSGQPGRR